MKLLTALGKRNLTVQNAVGSQYRVLNTGTVENLGVILFEAAKETGAQVRGFRPALRSLEDVFLEAIV